MEAFLKRRFIYAGNMLILSDRGITNITTHLKQDRLKYRKYKVFKNMKHIQESIIGRKSSKIAISISDLRYGDIVKLRNPYIFGIINKSEDRIICYLNEKATCVFIFLDYYSDLTYIKNKDYDVMEVWRDPSHKLVRELDKISRYDDLYLKFISDLKNKISEYNMVLRYERQ